MMQKQTKAHAIPTEVKQKVFDRDNHCCIWCGSPAGLPEAHIVPRSQGGLGIEQNVVTLCRNCHERFDNTPKREEMYPIIKGYMMSFYHGWDEGKVKYRKESNEGI